MEAINSMASAAAKAVWGEGNNTDETKKEEPVSGAQGDTSKGEPFDAGNKDETSKMSTTDTKAPGTTNPSTELPSTTADTAATGGSSKENKAQADVRDPENPTADPKTEAERKNVDDSGKGVDASENPAKVDGPGPKPIDEVAKEHGGDAGKSSEGVDKSSAGKSGAAGGADDEDEDGPNAKSKGEGTGEQYVKSTGLAADGGDFDATKPGAGREADRLMEEKGISNPAGATSKPSEDSATPSKETGSPDSKGEKKSLKDKIKAKLHKN